LTSSQLKSPVPLFRPADLILIVLLGAVSFSVFHFSREAPGGDRIRVAVDGITRISVGLSADTVFTIRGVLGDTEIGIQDGRARILRSPCPMKICRHQGAVSNSGGMLICIPNRVTVTVEGDDPAGSGVDGITQ
jgi:hypothetical protein